MNPRLVSEADAAAYVSLDIATFRRMVTAGVLPAQLPDFGLYDLRAIDAAIDRLSEQRAEDAETRTAAPLPPLDDYSPQNVFLVPRELSERWGVSEGVLANLRANGEGIPYTKPTGSVLYRLSDVLTAEAEAKDIGYLGFRWAWLHKILKSCPGITSGQSIELLRHFKRTMR